MYTIQFGTRAHLMTDASAQSLKASIEAGEPFATVHIALGGEDEPEYEVTLNIAHVVAIIKHPDVAPSVEHRPTGSRPQLVLVG